MSVTSSNTSRPRPIATAYSGFYWEGARDGRLLIQTCRGCGRYQHPPGPICARCGGFALEPAEVSGNGVVHSFAIVNHVFHPAFSEETPYVVARIELDEQPDLIVFSNIRECTPKAVHVGMRVSVMFETVGQDVLPQFRPAIPSEPAP